MEETMIYVPLNLLLELTECRGKLRVIQDCLNCEDFYVNRENLAVIGGFELKEFKENADV